MMIWASHLNDFFKRLLADIAFVCLLGKLTPGEGGGGGKDPPKY